MRPLAVVFAITAGITACHSGHPSAPSPSASVLTCAIDVGTAGGFEHQRTTRGMVTLVRYLERVPVDVIYLRVTDSTVTADAAGWGRNTTPSIDALNVADRIQHSTVMSLCLSA